MNQAKQEIIRHKLATALFNVKTGMSQAGDGTTARTFLEVSEIYLNEITEAIGPLNTLSEAIVVAVLRYLKGIQKIYNTGQPETKYHQQLCSEIN
nr:hypothetical protein [uncultured Anaerostipes sp.]